MFKIKICGITTVEDALLAAEAGADAIGLNFYEKSVRYVTLERAREISQATPTGPEKIGVFVNMPVCDVAEVFRTVPLDAVQIHGDEPPEYLMELRQILPTVRRPSLENPQIVNIYSSSIIRAFRWAGGDFQQISAYLRECQALNALPNAVLIDAHVGSAYGGTGATVNWKSLVDHRTPLLNRPLFLAGGLTSHNVVEAIKACRPDWVDVASGVERSPGKKDPAKIRAFCVMARIGWSSDAVEHMFDGLRPPPAPK